jgi:hypothetical protein
MAVFDSFSACFLLLCPVLLLVLVGAVAVTVALTLALAAVAVAYFLSSTSPIRLSQLHRMFSRIRGHEKMQEEGVDPAAAARKAEEGTYEADAYPAAKRARREQGSKNKGEGEGEGEGVEGEGPEFDQDAAQRELEELSGGMGVVFDAMPTEEQMAEARRNTPAVPYEEDEEEEEDVEGEEEGEGEEEVGGAGNGKGKDVGEKFISRQRQTLLFSATALRADIVTGGKKGQKKWLDGVKVKGIGSGAVKQLPSHMQQLLSLVGVQGQTEVVDVTGGAPLGAGAKGKKGQDKAPATGAGAGAGAGVGDGAGLCEEEEEEWDGHEEGGATVLPKGLMQCEYRVPAEDKDVMAYYYLLKVRYGTLTRYPHSYVTPLAL